MTVRQRTWEILEVGNRSDRTSRRFDIAIRTLIGLNVVAVVLETVPTLDRRLHGIFVAFEAFSVAVFAVEYMARVWSSVESPAYRRRLRGRVRFALTPLALIDLLAVLPYLFMFVGLDLGVLRGVRLFRLFGILKLTRYTRSVHTMARVFRRSRDPLVLTLSGTALALLVASSLMYYVEHGAQPEQFTSIPAAMWWGVVTLTTLGYGDMYPVTTIGRIMGGVFAISGILLIALPTAILGAAFVEETQDEDSASWPDDGPCPTCGQPVLRPVTRP